MRHDEPNETRQKVTSAEPNLPKPTSVAMSSPPSAAAGRRRIGDLTVHPIGLGGMRLSIEGRPDRERAIATIRAAVESGAELIDTADAYHASATDDGHNELLVADALQALGNPPVLVATKGGKVRPGDGRWLADGRPEHLRAAARVSARRLGVDAIGLYQLHAPDPEVPFRESLEALSSLVDDGVALRLGVSNVTAAQLREAYAVLGQRLVAVQNELSPTALSSLDVLAVSEELELAFLAWRPLGAVAAGDRGDDYGAVARSHGVSLQRIVLAWLLRLSPVLLPIPGSTRPETARDSAAAAALELSAEDRARLERSHG